MPLMPGTDEFEEATRDIIPRGCEIYESKIRACVEPEYNDQYVAIHVDSGDYVVAQSTAEAARGLEKIRPEAPGRIFLRKIGDVPDYAFAARIMAGKTRAIQGK